MRALLGHEESQGSRALQEQREIEEHQEPMEILEQEVQREIQDLGVHRGAQGVRGSRGPKERREMLPFGGQRRGHAWGPGRQTLGWLAAAIVGV
ncbi:hypothetical protein GJAV_G00205500 [Gymnothorax javanicus]|nr:hypothetical protein GJAV_G00205500 [Gymnothorax javanicus]